MKTAINGTPSLKPSTPQAINNGRLAGKSLQVGTGQKKQRAYWEKSYGISVPSTPTGNRAVDSSPKGLKGFSANQLPRQGRSQVWVQQNDGSHRLASYKNSKGGIDLKLYGNPGSQYVSQERRPNDQDSIRHRDAFALAIKKTKKIPKRAYPIACYSKANDVKMDRGHGIDHALTIIENKHSSIDERNYTPQNAVYNRTIRNHLVGALSKKTGFSYKEVCIYGKKPSQINHKIPKKYSKSGKVETHSIDVPEGFLFVTFDASKKEDKIYYFPNFIDYKAIKGQKKPTYLDIAKSFEIKKEKFTLWGREIGLFDTNIYSRKDTKEDIDIKVRSKALIGYQMLSGRLELEFEDADNAKKWIPRDALNALTRTIALKQLYEMANSEFTSVEYKLSCASTLLDQFTYIQINEKLYNPAQAKVWLKRAAKQVKNESSIEDKIHLYDFYNSSHKLSNNKEAKALWNKIIKQIESEGCSIQMKFKVLYSSDDSQFKKLWVKKIDQQISTEEKSDNKEIKSTALQERKNLNKYLLVEECNRLRLQNKNEVSFIKSLKAKAFELFICRENNKTHLATYAAFWIP